MRRTGSNYSDLFNNYFEKASLGSTYKPVFLHALTDVALFDNDDLIGKQWISVDNDTITLDLNFIAVRLTKAYWPISDFSIYHTPASAKDIPSKEITILKIIQNQKAIHPGDVSLETLSSDDTSAFRKSVIQQSIKPEVLKKLKNDFGDMYETVPRKDLIRFDIELINFMKRNRSDIQKKAGRQIRDYLERLNSGIENTGILVEESSPFFEYARNIGQRLFLVGINTDELMKNFEEMVQSKVSVPKQNESREHASVWGLRSTQGNVEVWTNIRRNDLVLFVKDNRCVAKCVVSDTFRDSGVGSRLWKDAGERTVRDLLIVFDRVTHFNLELQDSRIRLINPTMLDEYHFPIKQVDQDMVYALFQAYGDLENALDNMSDDHLNQDTSNVDVRLVKANTTVRKGQGHFREKIMENYYNTCAVCEISEPALVDASHVLPVRNIESAGDVENGICLCVLHHRMLDRGYICFNSDYNLVLSDSMPEYLKDTCVKKKISVFTCKTLPSKKYLQKSWNLFEKMGKNGR